KFPASRNGGGMVDAPGRRVVGGKGKSAIVTTWGDVFSPGEQRLAFARLPVNRPRYAFYIPFRARVTVPLLSSSTATSPTCRRIPVRESSRVPNSRSRVPPDEQKRIPDSNRIGSAAAGFASPSSGEHHFQPATSVRRRVAFERSVEAPPRTGRWKLDFRGLPSVRGEDRPERSGRRSAVEEPEKSVLHRRKSRAHGDHGMGGRVGDQAERLRRRGEERAGHRSGGELRAGKRSGGGGQGRRAQLPGHIQRA